MKILILSLLIFIPALSFSGNCLETEKNFIININSESTKPFIIEDPECPLNFLSLTVYNRWGQKVFDKSITSIYQLPKLNDQLAELVLDKEIKEGTYFAMVKYTYLGNPEQTELTTSILILK